MRTIVVAIAAAVAAVSCQAEPVKSDTSELSAPIENARVLAVLSYADWCGNCKVLDPKIKAAQAANAFDGVEFVTLDYTAR
ncbi:MAG: thioredoxin family protein, partial [Pseudomonadota bacterium]